MKIAFIGLGIMGSRMAANLQKAGMDLIVFNRTKDKANELLAAGATWAESPAEAVKEASIIVTMLGNPEAVEAIALGESGILNHAPKGSLWIDSSTVNPSFSKAMAAAATNSGIRFLDAPVAGTKAPAEKGELVFFVGGESADRDEAEPLFQAMGSKAVHLGEHGKGASMKMLINLMLAQSMLAFSEALVLGESMGLHQGAMLDILLNAPVTAPFLKNVRPRIESPSDEINFPLKWMQKDIQLATQTAYENGIAMPSLNAAKETYALAKQMGFGEKDFSSIHAFLAGNSKN